MKTKDHRKEEEILESSSTDHIKQREKMEEKKKVPFLFVHCKYKTPLDLP
jgi:hypothetical protein